MEVSRLDHLVLTVRNINDTVVFYKRVMAMELVTFTGGRKALTFGNQKINLHQYGSEFEPKAGKVTPGSADLCFIIDTPISDALAHLIKCGVKVLEGPIERTGATGTIMSLYFRDPDDNLIEISNYI